MDKSKIEAFYQTQVSLSEWFRSSGYKKTEEFNEEDNEKRERLRWLNEIIGLPFDKPVQFLATELVNKTPEVEKYIQENGKDLCAIRLIPYDIKLPKLRMRGETVAEAVKWFLKQEIEPKNYKVDFVPHSDNAKWSSILVVNKKGISGELIKDSHSHLTQGFYEEEKPILFYYDFKKWKLSRKNAEALKHLKTIIKKLKIIDSKKKKLIKEKFEADFYHNFIGGYWETVCSLEFGLWFIDYNRILGEMYKDYELKIESKKKKVKKTIIKGYAASGGTVVGKVKIIKAEEVLEIKSIDEGTIIICDVTTPDFVPLMKKCLAIVTDRGGILSHAGIVARELGLPCIVATKNATTVLKDGMKIKVEADKGIIKVLE